MTTSTATLTTFLLARLDEEDADVSKYCMEYGGIWSPDRISMEVEAKRRIVELHHEDCPRESACQSWDGTMIYEPCPTLRALASVYRDHPEFREEWA